MNKFAERFKELRLDSGLSVTETAKKLEVSPRLILYWEKGQRQCDFDMLIKIAKLFSASIDYLLGLTDL